LIASALSGAAAARAAARTILAEGRFHAPSVPRPLHGLLHAIGDAIKAPGRWVVNAVDQLGNTIPGGAVVVWAVLALLLIGATAAVVRRQSSRALLEGGEPGRGGDGAARRAAELEHDAEQAEREGRLAEAVRLRFAAGLARLAERGLVVKPGSTPTGELARTLRSPDFDSLARRFDQIAYGAAPAEPADVEQARRQWPAVTGGKR
jgi:hypothetical protein